MNSTNVKQENINMDEKRFNDLLSEKDIAKMSNETLNTIFKSICKYITKCEMYPHLSGKMYPHLSGEMYPHLSGIRPS